MALQFTAKLQPWFQIGFENLAFCSSVLRFAEREAAPAGFSCGQLAPAAPARGPRAAVEQRRELHRNRGWPPRRADGSNPLVVNCAPADAATPKSTPGVLPESAGPHLRAPRRSAPAIMASRRRSTPAARTCRSIRIAFEHPRRCDRADTPPTANGRARISGETTVFFCFADDRTTRHHATPPAEQQDDGEQRPPTHQLARRRPEGLHGAFPHPTMRRVGRPSAICSGRVHRPRHGSPGSRETYPGLVSRTVSIRPTKLPLGHESG